MKLLRTLWLGVYLAAGASAAPILTLLPTDGIILGPQGTTVGWGFTLVSDQTNWTLITAVQMNVAIIGTFEDYLSAWVGTNAFALAPGSGPLVQAFAAGIPGTTATGLAGVTIAANAPVGPFSGSIGISYELYDADPFTGGNLVETGLEFTRSFTINVSDAAAPVPEPQSGLLLAMALGLVAWWKTKRSQME